MTHFWRLSRYVLCFMKRLESMHSMMIMLIAFSLLAFTHLCGHSWCLLQEKGMVEGLTWDCSDEFDATSEQPISFLSDQSFISFPNWISRTGAMVSFKVNNIYNMILFGHILIIFGLFDVFFLSFAHFYHF